MKNQIRTLKKASLVLTAVFIVIGIGLVLTLISKKPTNKPATPLQTGEGVGSLVKSKPIRLIITSIQVDAEVEPMGITSAGDMESPSGPKTVGWYKFGPYPGESGNAVIAGHFGPWQNGETSVFNNLSQLKKGDTIDVVNEHGINTTFEVRELRVYDKDADTSEVFGKGDGRAHLNIITCTGSWNSNQKIYSKRLVVFADKV